MNPYQMTFFIVMASMVFWGGMTLGIVTALSTNLITFRFQTVTPVKSRRKIKRLTGIQADAKWETIESWSAAGWDLLLDEEHGVRVHTLIMEKRYP